MTDEEIIKALECCCEAQNCTSCIYNPTKYQKGTIGCCNELMENTIDLINRQKTEIDKLKIEICALSEKRITFPERLKIVKHARKEAIKEFAERLKANMSNIARMEYDGHTYFCVGYGLIDNLVKEMTESEVEENGK